MTKWNLIVDVAKCTNCNLCTLACQDEHVGNDFPGYAAPMPKHGHRWIEIRSKERGRFPQIDVAHLPTMCNHCDAAPCIAVAEDGAVKKRDDGIVIIDPQKARGQRGIVDACPYGAVWWNEALQLPQHWIFDAHLLDAGWTAPRAVTGCATGALTAVRVEDARMVEIARDEGLEVLRPELGTRPRVYYKNLHRYAACFIAGSLAAEVDGTVDCVVAARVILEAGGEAIAETVS
ncbi:MAG: oxidoreductase, partial [Rhodospirillales bacterium]|nr:oxidoreductase [Rhodospirillales bacterium]